MKSKLTLLLSTFLLLSITAFSQELTDKWTSLLTQDGRYFEKYIGIPHTSLTSLPGVEKGNGTDKGKPLGLNNDPLNVFTIEMVDGQPVLHISGEIFGGFSTKKEFGNYHLRVEVKWGEKKYEPRLTAKRDNGILFHGKAPHGQFWNVWYRAPEFQIEEGNMGDLYTLAGVGADVRSKLKDTTNKRLGYIYDPEAPLRPYASTGTPETHLSHKKGNYENPIGEWNIIDLICYNDQATYAVNGSVVMTLENIRTVLPGTASTPLTNGFIQFQSEGAECYYRNIQIKKVDRAPDLK